MAANTFDVVGLFVCLSPSVGIGNWWMVDGRWESPTSKHRHAITAVKTTITPETETTTTTPPR